MGLDFELYLVDFQGSSSAFIGYTTHRQLQVRDVSSHIGKRTVSQEAHVDGHPTPTGVLY